MSGPVPPRRALPVPTANRMLTPMIAARITALALLAIACSGCGSPPSATEEGMGAAAPEPRIEAMLVAARNDDASATARLVEQLDSDDPAVRMTAILTLERITGRTMAYRYDAPVDERRRAIERWAEWVEAGQPDDAAARDEGDRPHG